MEPEQFFYHLREKAINKFKQSPVYLKQTKDWGVSVCDTTIKPGKLIFAGINWGGNKNFGIQDKYPIDDRPRKYKFLNGIDKLLEKNFKVGGIKEINYTNVCFFRTPKADMLESDDWRNAIELFQEYVEYIQPPGIIILGKSPIMALRNYKQLSSETLKYFDNKTVYAYKGILFEKYKTFGVPHTNSHISGEIRNLIWKDAADFLIN